MRAATASGGAWCVVHGGCQAVLHHVVPNIVYYLRVLHVTKGVLIVL